LVTADRQAEEAARHVRQLMGLIDDKAVRAGEDLTASFIPQREVGAQQMVVDDDQIRPLGPAPGLDQVAMVPVRAALAQAVVGAGGHCRPHGGVLGQIELGHVAAAGHRGPVAYLEQLAT